MRSTFFLLNPGRVCKNVPNVVMMVVVMMVVVMMVVVMMVVMTG